jgi:hypothetical protein
LWDIFEETKLEPVLQLEIKHLIEQKIIQQIQHEHDNFTSLDEFVEYYTIKYKSKLKDVRDINDLDIIFD